MKKIVDERQEKDLLKAEHYGFWVMFWGLCAVIMYQILFVDNGITKVLGETAVLLVGGIVVLIVCIKKGAWCYSSEPTLKNYLFYDVIFTVVYGAIYAVEKYMHSNYFKENIKMLVISTGIYSVFTFVLLFAVLFICGTFVKRRRKKLEDEFEDDDM